MHPHVAQDFPLFARERSVSPSGGSGTHPVSLQSITPCILHLNRRRTFSRSAREFLSNHVRTLDRHASVKPFAVH
jgi:hypothetical protein